MTGEPVLEVVRAGGLLAAGRPVVVMVSGGRDSVCLLDVAVRIAGARAVRALHVDYALRPSSAADAELCSALCRRLAVELTIVAPGAAPPTGNLQAWARNVRYAAAGELAAETAQIATGHTATDQVETILYRLASSPSRRALLGMRERDGRLIRPLLPVTREQTAAHCNAAGLEWHEDETNESDRFARGRVRASLVPALRAIHPAAEANVLALASTLRAEAEVLDTLVDDVLEGRREVALARLRRLPRALARLVVQRLADDAVDRPAPGTARRLDELLALRDTGSAALDLPSGVRANVAGGILSFTARSQASREDPEPEPRGPEPPGPGPPGPGPRGPEPQLGPRPSPDSPEP